MPTDVERYEAALHAMQSGVAFEMSCPDRSSATEPKYLRVGVNSALGAHSALTRLLIEKGLFTQEEYFKVLADAMEDEAAQYQERANERFGRPGIVKFK